MKILLSELKIGQKARILGFKSGYIKQAQRFFALGLIPDRVFTLIRKAPFGDPIEICINNDFLCLRKEESTLLDIELIEN